MIATVALVVAALIYANFVEWAIHKYLLHDFAKTRLGRKVLGFHWYRHHRQARLGRFKDKDYQRPIYDWNARTKEVVALSVVALLHLPFFFLSPWVYGAMCVHVVVYYCVHAKAHRDPSWALRWVPWHFDHHLGKNQDKNFCVTYPLADLVLGTRVSYRI